MVVKPFCPRAIVSLGPWSPWAFTEMMRYEFDAPEMPEITRNGESDGEIYPQGGP
jgi:hypothetical protein